MRSEQSFGVVPFRKQKEGWQVLLVHRNEGFWEFPKGHAEEGENPLESATRELKEESGMDIYKLIVPDPIAMDYYFYWEGTRIHKTVFYYLAEVEGKEQVQLEEIQGFRWVPLEVAGDHLTHVSSKKLFQEVLNIITNLNNN